MAIEKIRKNGRVVAYRSNVYYKGERYVGVRRTNLKEAQLDELEQKRTLLTGTHFKETGITLDQGYNDYITLIATKRLSVDSLNSTKSIYKKHIKPKFGHRQMSSIKPLEIQRFLNEKENELANASIIKLHTLLNRIYKTMIEWEELQHNPLNGVKKPPTKHKKGQTWTKEEAQTFLEVAKEYQAYMAFYLALNFGLRFSDILGLEWQHIDFTNKILSVKQAYHEVAKEIGTVKSLSSIRDIPISNQQLEVLKKHKKKSTY